MCVVWVCRFQKYPYVLLQVRTVRKYPYVLQCKVRIPVSSHEPVERVYIKYDPKNNLTTHKATLPNQRDKEVKALTSAVCVTNEANQNLTPSQKELL